MPLNTPGSSGGAYAAPTASSVEQEPDYLQQNALGMAKIMQTNPMLGEAMAKAYEAKTEQSTSLLSGMWNTITSPVRKGLSFLGNVSSAAAEPFRNEGEGEENDPLTDIWQGLAGSENTTWRENLVSYGAPKDHWATTTLGLAGDVLLDPTNYLGAGGLGLARDVVATGAKELGEHAALSLLRDKIKTEGGMRIAGKLVTDADDLPTVFANVTREEFQKLGVADEMIDTLSGIAAGNADRTILSSIDDAQNVVAEWAGERIASATLQGKSIRTLPKTMTDPLGGTWKRDDFIRVFQDTSRMGPEDLNKLANHMYGGDVGYGTSGMIGRKAAAALGGVRFKFGIPFTKRISDAHAKPWLGYRWQTNAIPLLPRFKVFGSGEGPVMNKMGNFFRGLSGMNRLDTAIEESIKNGDGLWKKEDMSKFLRLGFKNFEHALIDEGRGAQFQALFGNKATTMFMSASDRVGGLTAHLTPKAQLWRRLGYTGMRGGQEIRNAAIGKKMFREYGAQNEHEWAIASHRLDKEVAKGNIDPNKVYSDMINYLEGIDDNLDALPDFLRVPAKQMKKMFPMLHKEARKYGATVGDMGEVFARRRSETALKVYQDELAKLTSRLTAKQANAVEANEALIAEVGEEAAAAMKSPELSKLEVEIAEIQDSIGTILESQKSLSTEIDMMDEYDNMIKFLRPDWPVEKLGPKGYFQRRMTKEAREAIRGSLQAKYKNWGRAKQVTAQMERILATQGFEESAKTLRGLHPEALKNVKKVWEDNPFGVYASYVEDMSEAVYRAQLKGAADHVMGYLGAVDNGLAMRITAHIPADLGPKSAQARYGVPDKFKNLADTIDRIQVAIGGRVLRTAHAEGSAVWANVSKQAGKNMEPWRDKGMAQFSEYLDIDDIWDLREFDRAGSHAIGAATGASKGVVRERITQLEKRMNAQTDAWRAQGKNPLDVDDEQYQKWVTEHMQLERELMQLEKGVSLSRKTIDTLKEDILANGVKEPLMLMFSKVNHGLKIGEGNHRMQALRELVDEGHDEFRYVPARIQVSKSTEVESYGLPTTVLDQAHLNGTNFDWETANYVPAEMKPSELFAMEAGRLGKIGDLSEEDAFKMSVALHELNRAKSQVEGVVAPTEVAFKKIEADVDMSQWGRVAVPGLEEFAMHPFLAAEFNRAYEGLHSLPEWRQNWRKFVMGPWKKAATIYFPGFHAKNFMGAWYNNFLGGVTTEQYSHMHRVSSVLRDGDKSEWAGKTFALKVLIDGEVVDNLTYRDLATLMQSRGIVGGNGLAVADLKTFLGRTTSSSIRGKRAITSKLAVGKIGRYQHKTLGEVTAAEQLMRNWEAWGIRTTNTTENFFRGAAFLKGLEDAAGDTAGARNFVMMRHGDYDELTDFENGIRDLVPFYKWMRTNLPFKIRRLFEDPAKQLATFDIQEALVPEEKRKEMKAWMRDSLTIPMPKGLAKLLGSEDGAGVLTAQLPLHDVFVSSGEFASSFLPVVRQVIETGVLKKSLLSGAPVDNVNMVPAANWMQTVGLAPVLQAVGIGEEGEDGKFYLSTAEMNMMNVFPIFARSRQFLTDDPDRQTLRFASLISATTGTRPEDMGLDQNEGEKEWYYGVLLPQLQQLTELGYKLPTAYDLGMAASQSSGGAYGSSSSGGAYGS